MPDTVRSGKMANVSWAASTDPESDAVSYEVERWNNSTNAWAQIYAGTAETYVDTLTIVEDLDGSEKRTIGLTP